MAAKNNSLRQVTLHIPESNYLFFMELIKHLKFVKKIEIKDVPEKKQVLKNVKAGLEEVSLFKKGKLITTPDKDSLNNL